MKAAKGFVMKRGDKHVEDAGAYLPTPLEIQMECERIRAGWSWVTRQTRDMRKHTPTEPIKVVTLMVQDGRRRSPVDYETGDSV